MKDAIGLDIATVTRWAKAAVNGGRRAAAAGCDGENHRPRGWLRDTRGVVAIVFALALLPLAIGAGMAVDLSRAYIVKSRLNYALDAAGLAVGSSSGTQEELQTILESYFYANYPVTKIGVPAQPSMSIVDNEIRLSATAEVNTLIMSVIGVNNIEVAVDTVIVRETKNLEIALVLDNTGSMGGLKMMTLREASTEMVNTLFDSVSGTSVVKFAVVPFASAVNIGSGNVGLLDASYDPANFSPDVWRGCVEARPHPADVRDTAIFDPDGGAWAPYLWPSNSTNLWPTVRGSRGQIRGPNKDCPVSLLPLTDVRDDVIAKINALDARGFTMLNVGAMWGWRVLSPGAPFTEGAAYSEPDTVKVGIIMTDGENTISSNCDNYSAYGSLCDGRLGTTSDPVAARNELDSRLLEVCSGMKGLGITFYTITFQVTDPATITLMQNCASAGKYFDSPDVDGLGRVFNAIGAELSNLRIGR